MSQRVKYPLTPNAKETARYLVAAWDKNEVQQAFYLVDVTAGSSAEGIQLRGGLGTQGTFQPPSLGIIRELAEYKLISLDRVLADRTGRFEVNLLQELRNAIQNDFEVSEFFLTTSAVGTIIHGNLTLEKGALFQSAAGGGDVTVTAEMLPDELIRLLGEETLHQYPNINQAIQALKTADEPTRIARAGKVIEELGRGLEHLSNASGALTAIAMIARVLSGGGL